jgi:hypothetical protein
MVTGDRVAGVAKYISHWARKVPAAGVGRLPALKRVDRAAAALRTAVIRA